MLASCWPLSRLWYRGHGIALQGQPDDDVWYFAYGANMHDSAFRERRRMTPREARPGRIDDYRLRFNLDGRPKGKAAPANIEAETDAEVWGVLYLLKRRDLIRLDATEGVPGPPLSPSLGRGGRPGWHTHQCHHLYCGRQRERRQAIPSLHHTTARRRKAAWPAGRLDRLFSTMSNRRWLEERHGQPGCVGAPRDLTSVGGVTSIPFLNTSRTGMQQKARSTGGSHIISS